MSAFTPAFKFRDPPLVHGPSSPRWTGSPGERFRPLETSRRAPRTGQRDEHLRRDGDRTLSAADHMTPLAPSAGDLIATATGSRSPRPPTDRKTETSRWDMRACSMHSQPDALDLRRCRPRPVIRPTVSASTSIAEDGRIPAPRAGSRSPPHGHLQVQRQLWETERGGGVIRSSGGPCVKRTRPSAGSGRPHAQPATRTAFTIARRAVKRPSDRGRPPFPSRTSIASACHPEQSRGTFHARRTHTGWSPATREGHAARRTPRPGMGLPFIPSESRSTQYLPMPLVTTGPFFLVQSIHLIIPAQPCAELPRTAPRQASPRFQITRMTLIAGVCWHMITGCVQPRPACPRS